MIYFKEQEKIVEIPSLREFQPFMFFVEFVNKFCGTSDNTSSFKLDLKKNHYTVVAYICPKGHQHILTKSEYKQSRDIRLIVSFYILRKFIPVQATLR